MLKKIQYFIVLLFTFVQFSCKDYDEYHVDNEFAKYVQRFVVEGEKRGRSFNFEESGLIIEFADLEENTAGLCHYENPIRIEIDSIYWRNIGKSAGVELLKEDIIFHEMGHGILGRRHLNTVLENGDWKSIMCGGDKVDGRSWNINYHGQRRDYYLDELFKESTPIPDIFGMNLPVDTSGFIIKLNYSFDNEASMGWKLTSNSQYSTASQSGKLRFTSKINKTYFVFAKTNIDVQSDFSFEFNIHNDWGDNDFQSGMIFGFNPESDTIMTTESIEYFNITNQQKMFMGNRTWYSFYTELTKPQIYKNTENKLKVVKINDMMYYFINNIYVYCTEIEVKSAGFHYGFSVPGMSTVWIDNFKIATKSPLNIKGVKYSQPDIQFHCIPVENLYQQNIPNK